MKTIIKKFWGVALVVMMLSSLFVVSAPAAAGSYVFGDALALPTATAGQGFIDVAQSGDTVYALGYNTVSTLYSLYKSADGGVTWAAVALPAALAAPATPTLVAVAPDDPNVVAVVNTNGATDQVYMSLTGGAGLAAITAFAANTNISAIDISPPDLVTGRRSIVVGGYVDAAPPVETDNDAYLATWEIGNFAATWVVPFDTLPATMPVLDNILAVAWSPDYQNDTSVLYVGVNIGTAAAGNVSLHAYSWLYADYDADIDASYPRVLASSAAGVALTCARATLVLDDLFSLLGFETGFIGAQITVGAAEAGNVFRINTGSAALTPISATAIAINSVAWDGVNLMAGPFGAFVTGIPVYRSSVAATTAGLTPSIQYKFPGTGNSPIVFWAGGNGFCVSQGNNAAMAKTTDLGRSFNGVALYNTNLNNVIDFWVKSDGTTMYALSDDGVDINLWQRSGGVWQRIATMAGKTTEPWLVRTAESDTNAIYLAKKGAKNMLKSTDGGTVWAPKNSTQNIADFAVSSASLVYVVSSTSGAIIKTSGATWAAVGTLGGVGYSMTLLADGTFVVGGATGNVGYYNGTAFTAVATALGTGPVVVAASGTATGDVIYAASATDGGVGTWTIGGAAWAALTADTAGNTFTGVAYANGVAYAYNNEAAANDLYRYLPAVATDVIVVDNALTFTQTNMVNALQMTAGSNMLWARNSATNPDTIQTLTDSLLAAVPTLSFPMNDDLIPLNSLNGAVNPFILQWAAPAGVVLPVGTMYTVTISYDAAGLIVVPAVGITNTVAATNVLSTIWSVGGVTPFTPGESYFWSVQITAPIHSVKSAVGSFTIQSASYVVSITSPPSGSVVTSLTPGFTWTPIPEVTGYEFQLAKESEFVLMVYTANSTTSSAALPVALRLVDGEDYYWRVRAITPAVGEWSEVGLFTVGIPVPPTTPVTVTPPTVTATQTVITTPTLTVTIPPVTPPAAEKISPAYIWAIIIIGAVLVIAVIVLIVRTRRSV